MAGLDVPSAGPVVEDPRLEDFKSQARSIAKDPATTTIGSSILGCTSGELLEKASSCEREAGPGGGMNESSSSCGGMDDTDWLHRHERPSLSTSAKASPIGA